MPHYAFGPAAAPALAALRGHRFFDGEAGAGGPAPTPTPPAAAVPAVPAPPAPVPTPPAPAAAASPAGAESVDGLPDWAQKVIREARGEAAGYRAAKNTVEQQLQEFKDAAAVTLGLKEPAQQNPAALAAALKAAQDTARENAVKLATFQVASTKNANAAALLDSNAFLTATKNLDPTAGDFTTSLAAAIETAIQGNPHLKAVRATGASSADLPAGGSGENGPITEEQLRSADADQIVAWHKSGAINHLL